MATTGIELARGVADQGPRHHAAIWDAMERWVAIADAPDAPENTGSEAWWTMVLTVATDDVAQHKYDHLRAEWSRRDLVARALGVPSCCVKWDSDGDDRSWTVSVTARDMQRWDDQFGAVYVAIHVDTEWWGVTGRVLVTSDDVEQLVAERERRSVTS